MRRGRARAGCLATIVGDAGGVGFRPLGAVECVRRRGTIGLWNGIIGLVSGALFSARIAGRVGGGRGGGGGGGGGGGVSGDGGGGGWRELGTVMTNVRGG